MKKKIIFLILCVIGLLPGLLDFIFQTHIKYELTKRGTALPLGIKIIIIIIVVGLGIYIYITEKKEIIVI